MKKRLATLRRIKFFFPGYNHGGLFDPSTRENSHEPFILLREKLRTLGYELETAEDEDLSGVYSLWFWDVTGLMGRAGLVRRMISQFIRTEPRSVCRPSRLLADALRRPLRDRLVLFLCEPPAVQAANFEQCWHRYFWRVFTWHDPLVDGSRYFKYFFPVPVRYPTLINPPFAKRKLLVNISGNKSSAYPGELYSARARSIRFFEAAAFADFDLFGHGWEQGDSSGAPYPSYKGTIEKKWDVLPHYRFALCYENQQMEGWVTEKIFDCLRCGVIPVYLGAPEIAKLVDPDCFIDRRIFEDDREVLSFLKGMSEETFLRRCEVIRAYLASPAFANFTSAAFADTVIRALGLGTPEDAATQGQQ